VARADEGTNIFKVRNLTGRHERRWDYHRLEAGFVILREICSLPRVGIER
jgi:hypothetical protein